MEMSVIVAGGARGIGAKTCEMYVEQGGRVLIGDVNDELGVELEGKLGRDKAVYPAARRYG